MTIFGWSFIYLVCIGVACVLDICKFLHGFGPLTRDGQAAASVVVLAVVVGDPDVVALDPLASLLQVSERGPGLLVPDQVVEVADRTLALHVGLADEQEHLHGIARLGRGCVEAETGERAGEDELHVPS